MPKREVLMERLLCQIHASGVEHPREFLGALMDDSQAFGEVMDIARLYVFGVEAIDFLGPFDHNVSRVELFERAQNLGALGPRFAKELFIRSSLIPASAQKFHLLFPDADTGVIYKILHHAGHWLLGEETHRTFEYHRFGGIDRFVRLRV